MNSAEVVQKFETRSPVTVALCNAGVTFFKRRSGHSYTVPNCNSTFLNSLIQFDLPKLAGFLRILLFLLTGSVDRVVGIIKNSLTIEHLCVIESI